MLLIWRELQKFITSENDRCTMFIRTSFADVWKIDSFCVLITYSSSNCWPKILNTFITWHVYKQVYESSQTNLVHFRLKSRSIYSLRIYSATVWYLKTVTLITGSRNLYLGFPLARSPIESLGRSPSRGRVHLPVVLRASPLTQTEGDSPRRSGGGVWGGTLAQCTHEIFEKSNLTSHGQFEVLMEK